jgi:hypothetical protein
LSNFPSRFLISESSNTPNHRTRAGQNPAKPRRRLLIRGIALHPILCPAGLWAKFGRVPKLTALPGLRLRSPALGTLGWKLVRVFAMLCIVRRLSKSDLGKATSAYLEAKSSREKQRLLGRRFIPLKPRKGRVLRASNLWQKWEIALLGKFPVPEIVRQTGRTRSSVVSKRMKMRISCVPVHKPWTRQEVALLGKLPDREVARRLGRKYKTVHLRRRQLGIPNSSGVLRFWSKAEDRMLGTDSDVVIGKKLGRSDASVFIRRRRLGIPSGNPSARAWTRAEARLLGKLSDVELARRLRRSIQSVRHRRNRLGLRQPNPLQRPWTREEDAVLGTLRDAQIAAELKRSEVAVQIRRNRLGIAPYQPRHQWRNKERALLGTLPDGVLARKLNTKSSAVSSRRIYWGIPPFGRQALASRRMRKRRPWKPEEDALLGTAPDTEIAARLDRHLSTVCIRRQQLGIPNPYWQQRCGRQRSLKQRHS